MNNLINKFSLKKETEDYEKVTTSIVNGVPFRGTNLWVLIFAIFVASLGLNINSTAVIIGAMLISPLMGPIMGIGLGMGVNDLVLIKKSGYNYLIAAGVGLITSTIYFLLTPLNDAHSEILARTSPNIYDVLIAFFGGLAGIVATSSKQKGNVIPGVAIATALMPPLCTAGYGLATLHFNFFFGAIYLFLINTVFIALATLITVRLLKFPYHHLPDLKAEKRAKRIVFSIVVITTLPSIYFGYDIVQQSRFSKNVTRFIENEAVFPDDYLLQKVIDAKNNSVILTYGGKKIEDSDISILQRKLLQYDLQNTKLEIRQGFAYLSENTENKNSNELTQLTNALAKKDNLLREIKLKLDSIELKNQTAAGLFKELNALYPTLVNLGFSPFYSNKEQKINEKSYMIYLQFSIVPGAKEKSRIENWLKIKMQKDIMVIFDK